MEIIKFIYGKLIQIIKDFKLIIKLQTNMNQSYYEFETKRRKLVGIQKQSGINMNNLRENEIIRKNT